MVAPPLFSVVIPLYNCRDYIGSAIQSVLNQTFDDFEIIMVDDGSTDSSDEIVKSIADPRIRYIRQENQGVSVARNTGIENAYGEFVAFLDADDYWQCQHLEFAAQIFRQRKDINWFASKYIRTPLLRSDNLLADKVYTDSKIETMDFYRKGYWFVNSSSVIIRKSAIGNQRFIAGMKLGEDPIFWYGFASRNPLIAINRNVSSFYFIRQLSATKKNRSVKTCLTTIQILCDAMVKQNPPQKNNFFFISFFYLYFYRKFIVDGREPTINLLSQYKKYLPWDIKTVFFVTVIITWILPGKAWGISYRYLLWRGIIKNYSKN